MDVRGTQLCQRAPKAHRTRHAQRQGSAALAGRCGGCGRGGGGGGGGGKESAAERRLLEQRAEHLPRPGAQVCEHACGRVRVQVRVQVCVQV